MSRSAGRGVKGKIMVTVGNARKGNFSGHQMTYYFVECNLFLVEECCIWLQKIILSEFVLRFALFWM